MEGGKDTTWQLLYQFFTRYLFTFATHNILRFRELFPLILKWVAKIRIGDLLSNKF